MNIKTITKTTIIGILISLTLIATSLATTTINPKIATLLNQLGILTGMPFAIIAAVTFLKTEIKRYKEQQ
jgi:hypothetical protein